MRKKKHSSNIRIRFSHKLTRISRLPLVRLLGVAAISCFIFSFVAFHNRIDIFVWYTFHTPDTAFVFNHDARFALMIGDYYFNEGGKGVYKPDIAKTYYKKALAIDPTVRNAWHQLSRIDFVEGDLHAAYDDINMQITLHGDSFPNSYYMRGLIEGYIGNLDAAEKDFQKALAIGDRSGYPLKAGQLGVGQVR